MDHVARLNLIARITYYLGWITAICGALLHFNLGTSMFVALHLEKRNLYEASVMFFLICMASELRTLAYGSSTAMPSTAKRQAA
jgi:hypothetical protein